MCFPREYRYLPLGFLLAVVLCGNAYRAAMAEQTHTFDADPESMIKALQSGGYLVYLRHAATDRNQTDIHPHRYDDCSTQRNLSQAGRKQAMAIGEAIRALDIPIGKVLTSPFCRCKDTAQLAFGKSEVSFDLSFGLGADAQQTAHLAQALENMLSTPPLNGTNTVLVSHTANLKEATGLWPKPEGAAYIFRPVDGGRYEFIGRLPPDAWPQSSAAR